LVSKDDTTCYEIKRIANARTRKGQAELWFEWKGYDQSQNCWVHRDILMTDVPLLVRAIDANSSIFKARDSAPQRATKGYKTPVASPPPRRSGWRSGADMKTRHQMVMRR